MKALDCPIGDKYTRLNSGGIQAGETQREKRSICKCGTSRRNRDAARKMLQK